MSLATLEEGGKGQTKSRLLDGESGGGGIYIWHLEFFRKRKSVFLPYLFTYSVIYLYRYEFVCVYFIVLGLRANTMIFTVWLTLSQLQPLGALSGWFPRPLDMSPTCRFLFFFF